MSVSFEHYWPLLALTALPIIWKVGFRTEVKIQARHLKVLSVIRACLIISLVLALMQPTWNRSVKWLSTVYAIDVSGSIEPNFIRSAIDWISRVDDERNPEHSAFVVFAGSSRTFSSSDQIASVEVSTNGSANSINQNFTDLGSGLRQAMNSFEPSYLKRLVLFTDGNSNAGKDFDVVMEAREKKVRIFTIPASVVGGDDSWIDAVDVPKEIRRGEPVLVEVQVYSRTEKDAVVKLTVGTDQNLERSVTLEEGLNSLPFEVVIGEVGSTTISARIEGQSDPALENNRLDRSVIVGDQSRVLYVEGYSESAHYLNDALEMEGIDVTLSSPANVPENQSELEVFDLIFLSDVSPEDLRQAQMDAVLRYVRDFGGGLVFAAGESSYGKEGYSGSMIEEILPIWFEVEEERKELALVIVLDKSYSMVGAKLELSKEAAKAALGIMDDRHRFGVVTFDDTPYVAVPLQLASEESRINQSISQIIAGSQTNIYPALDKAFEILAESEAEVRHIVLLSDGKTYADDYEELVRRMADEDITVSSVAVGEEADRDLLSDIAMWGNGRTYYIQDAQGVPQVFIKEAQIASQSTLIEERVVFEEVRSSEMFVGLDLFSAPDLEGYVKTRSKDNAETLIEVGDGSPILARWHYGLGRTAAFTSDVKNRWAINWLNWDGYGKFWTQLIRETMRRNDDPGLNFEVLRQGDQALITVSEVGSDGMLNSNLEPTINVTGPGSKEETLGLTQTEFGVYTGSYAVENSTDSGYLFELNTNEAGTEQKNFHYTYPDEYRRYPANLEFLSNVSSLTGGKLLPEEEEIFLDYGESTSVAFPLWNWSLFLALVLFLSDIAVRRLPWIWAHFSRDSEPGIVN